MILKLQERDIFASLKSEKVYKNLFTILIMVQQPALTTQPAQPAAVTQPAQPAQPAPATQMGQPEKKKSKWWIWTLVIIFSIAAGVAIGFFSFK